VEGFDAGAPAFGTPRGIYPSVTWNDVMSYCDFQWVSDYTYTAMYTFLTTPPARIAATARTTQAAGDLLSIFGVLDTNHNTATIHHLRRLSRAGAIPSRQAGDYSIRLLDAQGATLADYPFTPSKAPDAEGTLDIGQIVPFITGTQEVRIVKIAGGQALASLPVSVNPPAVNNVTLQGVPNPVTGTITLVWNATDPDGNTLKFDVLYSRNDGATFQPLQINLHTTSAQIDTSQLGSGQTIFRVLASDGANTAQADSAPFTVAAKPPQPRILNPGDGARVHWGTLINFMGEATDPQDGGVSGSGLIWTNQKGEKLGTGAVLTRDDLPVGVNKITLTATNSAGLSASASVTVIVDDNLNLPGSTLSVGPTQIGWHVAPARLPRRRRNSRLATRGVATSTGLPAATSRG
jgi:hypothetical protein